LEKLITHHHPETRGLLYVNVVMLLLFREYHINIAYDKMINIARIKKMARKLNIDMISKGILCLLRDVRKYTGAIHRVERAGGIVVWVVKIRNPLFYCNATFYNKAEAFEHLKKVNIKEELDIKNRFTVFEDKIVVALPDGAFTCDLVDIDVVEDYLWYSNKKGYVMARIDGKMQTFHNFITNNDNPFHVNVEFIDGNPLNCQRSNLQLVNKRVANIAHTSGVTGVHYDQRHRNWTVSWNDEQGDRHRKSFAVIKYGPACPQELAIEYRVRMIRALPHYANTLGLNE